MGEGWGVFVEGSGGVCCEGGCEACVVLRVYARGVYVCLGEYVCPVVKTGFLC